MYSLHDMEGGHAQVKVMMIILCSYPTLIFITLSLTVKACYIARTTVMFW